MNRDNTNIADRVREDARSKVNLVESFLRFIEKESVEYVVVGDDREHNNIMHGDLDIIVGVKDLERFPDILSEYCRINHGKMLQVLRHESSAWYFVLVFAAEDSRIFLCPDVCTDYIRNARLLLQGSELLADKRRGGGGYWVPRPSRAFAYYMLKKVSKNCIDKREFDYLLETRQKDLIQTDYWLQTVWSERTTRQIGRDFRLADFQSFKEKLPELRRSLIVKRPVGVANRLSEGGRWLYRATKPTGMVVAFLGPDGVGKSNVIAEVERQLMPAFRSTHRIHLKPSCFLKRKYTGTASQPHVSSARGVVGSIGKVVLWWAAYIVGYFLEILPRRIRSNLVLFDRHAEDLAIDPRRYRYGGPDWLANMLARAVPRPDLIFVLVADAKVIQERKSEVTLEETARQLREYRALARRRGLILVDANRPLESVVADITKTCFIWLEHRTRKRLRV